MGLLDNLKEQANLDKLKEQAMKRASQLVDKAQEKLGEMQSNEEEEEPEARPRTAEPSKREQTTSSQEERPVNEKRDEKPSYPQPQNQMFSKELEALIQATLEDGVLEDYEKAALARRAQAEGVDLAELEIYINSILQRRKKEQARSEEERLEAIDQKKKEAFGRVCPNCGKQVPPLTLKCECGYEFTANKQVSSVQLLANKIEKIRGGILDTAVCEKICETISMFPVPNTKEDIVEFLALSATNAKMTVGFWRTRHGHLIIAFFITLILALLVGFSDGGRNEVFSSVSFITSLIFLGIFIIGITYLLGLIFGRGKDRQNKIANAWRSKFDQVMIKARGLRGDAEFTQQLDYYESLLNKK